MISSATHDLLHWLAIYGYWAVLVFIAIESTGIPFPGETMLLVAAIYAGTTHHLSITLVIVVLQKPFLALNGCKFTREWTGNYRSCWPKRDERIE